MKKRATLVASGNNCQLSSLREKRELSAGLFRRLDPVLRGLSYKIAGERADLREDYFQEGALAVAKAQASFVPRKGNIDRYATRSAHGRMLNYHRKLLAQRNEVPVGLFAEGSPGDRQPPEAHVALIEVADTEQGRRTENRVDATMIWASAARILTRNERSVIHLMFFEGLRANEIAVELALSAPRITQLYASGVAKLRARFGY